MIFLVLVLSAGLLATLPAAAQEATAAPTLTPSLTPSITPTPTLTPQGDDQPITGLVIAEGSRVYVGPDFAYAIIGELPLDSSVVVLGRSGDFISVWNGLQWLQIDYGGTQAWVYARLIRTSKAFNSIPPTGRLLPRDRNGRVPDVFDLTSNICDQWQGGYTQSGDFLSGGKDIVVTYPGLTGANVYSVITISPSGFRTAFDSDTTTATIELDHLPDEAGTYTWRVAPYWTDSDYRYNWQQICLLRTGGTFERPVPTPYPTRTPS
ncbi:MAG TPA: SH3 domain-containing protein [Phototrophicaceae bacterium]|nr:SH3 domain-containing protein [Phototrophicaceae bacterium]